MTTIARRKLLAVLAGAAGWPLAARAQQPDRMRRVGMLMNLVADDPASRVRIVAFAQCGASAHRRPSGLRTFRRRSQVDQLFTHRWQLAQAQEAYRLFDRRTSGKGAFLME